MSLKVLRRQFFIRDTKSTTDRSSIISKNLNIDDAWHFFREVVAWSRELMINNFKCFVAHLDLQIHSWLWRFAHMVTFKVTSFCSSVNAQWWLVDHNVKTNSHCSLRKKKIDLWTLSHSIGCRKQPYMRVTIRHSRMCDNLNTEMYPDFRTKAESENYV